MTDMFYRSFEDRYRGSREVIAARLAAYVPFLSPLAAMPGMRAALDLGCGRGEWLELVGAMGFEASGVDLDDGMLMVCRERGLKVETNDALAALRARADNSLALVSAFHLVEHIGFDTVRALVTEALRVLQPGGLLIMETPNPENLSVGASSFYLDPSHQQPIPPTLLHFVTDYSGFARSKVVRLQENERARSGARPRLIDVLEGTSADYAVVAQKAAPEPIARAFDAPFGQEYGVTLGLLAERYDDELERTHALERQDDLAYVQRVAAELQDGIAAARVHIDAVVAHPLHRIAELEHRVNALEQQTIAYQQKIVDLLSSTSWRVTSPLRWAGLQAHRVRSAVREKRVVSGIKRRALPLVLAGVRAVLRNPRAKSMARTVLRRFPGLHARLYGMMTRSAAEAAASAAPLAHGAMSPRAQRVLDQLKYEISLQQKPQEQDPRKD